MPRGPSGLPSNRLWVGILSGKSTNGRTSTKGGSPAIPESAAPVPGEDEDEENEGDEEDEEWIDDPMHPVPVAGKKVDNPNPLPSSYLSSACTTAMARSKDHPPKRSKAPRDALDCQCGHRGGRRTAPLMLLHPPPSVVVKRSFSSRCWVGPHSVSRKSSSRKAGSLALQAAANGATIGLRAVSVVSDGK